MSADTEDPVRAEAAPPDEATVLWAARPWAFKNFAAVCEGDVFSVLFALEPVIRSFEFAPVDGAVSLEAPIHAPRSTYAERLLAARNHLLKNPRTHRFVQFDVKSTTGLEAGAQHPITGLRQHGKTAFYIVVCASDPGFAALVPNVPTARRFRSDEHKFAVGSNRSLTVGGVAYGYLDPGYAAHRMPIGLLAAAVQRVRDCAIASATATKKEYVNPWTGLAYDGWEPAITDSLEDMWPWEETEQYSACLGMLTLWRELRLARRDGDDVRFDMVGVQPRLADMKIIFKGRQWLVQCKSDVQERRSGQFDSVAIARVHLKKDASARGDGRCPVQHYFASHDRFDFLLYDFQFVNNSDGGPTFGFFFLPERVLPDEFFTSSDDVVLVSFDREEFMPYYVSVEENGDWGRHILDVIEQNPAPRRLARPPRDCVAHQPLARRVTARLSQLLRGPQVAPEVKPNLNTAVCHGRIFKGVLDECADRLSGILLVFAHNHAACDFGFARYAWTEAEREAYRATGRPPVTVHHLPAAMPVVPLYAFSRDMACDWRGPMLSGAEFRRVNSWSTPRLLVFDAMAAEDASFPGPLFVVPTEDLSVTARHLQEYKEHVEVSKNDGERHGRVPLIRELLHSGRNVADYALPKRGPAMYEASGGDWRELWTLLDKFTGTAHFAYPDACHREPERYRATLQQLHTRWWEEERRRAEDGVWVG